MTNTNDSAKWHRTLLINAIRFAAASTGEQKNATSSQLDPLQELATLLIDAWEHSQIYQRNSGRAVLNERESNLVHIFVNEVRQLQSIHDAQIDEALRILRSKAQNIINELRWDGPLDKRVFPELN